MLQSDAQRVQSGLKEEFCSPLLPLDFPLKDLTFSLVEMNIIYATLKILTNISYLSRFSVKNVQ